MVCLAALLPAATVAQAQYEPEPELAATEVQIEGGAVSPRGNLAEEYWETDLGFGASDGYELGFRFRYFLARDFSMSPAFHYADLKDFVDESTPDGRFTVGMAVIRYSLDFQYIHRRGRGGLHPVLGVGFSLCRNRYSAEWQELELSRVDGENSLAIELSVGLRVSEFELTLNYQRNRFDSYRLHDTGYNEQYNWDLLVLRLGWAFPTS